MLAMVLSRLIGVVSPDSVWSQRLVSWIDWILYDFRLDLLPSLSFGEPVSSDSVPWNSKVYQVAEDNWPPQRICLLRQDLFLSYSLGSEHTWIAYPVSKLGYWKIYDPWGATRVLFLGAYRPQAKTILTRLLSNVNGSFNNESEKRPRKQ